MKVVILAAGIGSRLGQKGRPKPLTLLDNKQSILEHQLKNLSSQVSLNQLLIVVGYHQEQIMAAFPNLCYIYNQNYAHENTAKSLLKALIKLEEDVLWINGDVVFHPSVLQKILTFSKTSMVVNQGEVGDEEVKYRQNDQGEILEVSKNVQNPDGEALGINYIEKKDLETFKNCLEKCFPEDYFEKGLEHCIQNNIKIKSVQVNAALCKEIDFPEDLEKANALMASWEQLL